MSTCAESSERITARAGEDARAPWSLLLLALGGLFFATEHDLTISRSSTFETMSDDLETTAEGGSWLRRTVIPGFALLGVALALGTPRPRFRPTGALAPLIALYLLFCVSSVVWSIDPAITVRRTATLVLSVVGTVGIARRLTLRQSLVLTLVLLSSFLALGIVAEVGLGTFRPWAAGYRFAGTTHPNVQGLCCAAICLAVLALWKECARHRTSLAAIGAAALVCLTLTKSRTSCAAFLAGLAALWMLTGARSTKLVAGLFVGWLLSAIGLVVVALDLEIVERLTAAALMGRQEEVGTLTGRLPMWATLWEYVRTRPVVGHGYTTFWTAEHILDVASELEYSIIHAHSAYVETLLGLGVVGAGLLLAAVLVALAAAAKRYRLDGEPACAFLVAMIVAGMVHGLTESTMATPWSLTILMGAGLLRLAFFPEASRPTVSPAPQRPGVDLAAFRTGVSHA